jgi:hypothetical protein
MNYFDLAKEQLLVVVNGRSHGVDAVDSKGMPPLRYAFYHAKKKARRTSQTKAKLKKKKESSRPLNSHHSIFIFNAFLVFILYS